LPKRSLSGRGLSRRRRGEGGGLCERRLAEGWLAESRLAGSLPLPQTLAGSLGRALASTLAREGWLTGVDVGVFADGGRRWSLLPEQFLAFEECPDGEAEQSERADPDRHVHRQQPAGGHTVDKNPDGDDNQRGAEPDHLPVISSCPGAPAMLGA
jgi:hypothetical protein